MVKVISFIKRRSGLDRADFLRYWRLEHVPLLLGLPGLRRQCTNIAIAIPGRDPRFDLVSEMWWAEPEQMAAAQSSAHGKEVAERLARVSAPAETISIVATERVVTPPSD